MKRAADFTGLLAQVMLWLAGFALVAMTAVIAVQVFLRYVLNSGFVGSEPISIMIMTWFIYLGAAVGIREGNHLSFDVLLLVLPDKVKPPLHTLSDIAVTAFGFGMIWFGFVLARQTAQNTLPSLGISGAFEYVPLMVGGVLAMLF